MITNLTLTLANTVREMMGFKSVVKDGANCN